MITSYPIILVDTSLSKLEAEIEKLIQNGPYVEAKMETAKEKNTSSTGVDDIEKVVSIEHPINYRVNMDIS